MQQKKRRVEILVLSDIHLGTYGCQAKKLMQYLKTIRPKTVVLNGDIIDIWQFSKKYWPKSHMKIVKHFMGWMSKGVTIYYVTGNHDEMLRRFRGFKMGSLQIVNKVVLPLAANKKAWFFHGDVFDVTMQHSKWLARLGAVGYDTLILLNMMANYISEKIFEKGRLSFSKRIKNSVKSAVKFINKFETTAADIGISNKYDYVICGHIHQPEIREITNNYGSIIYMNSGDWVENLTALEYNDGGWHIYKYDEALINKEQQDEVEEIEPSTSQLFAHMLEEFNIMTVS
jgi:UDP-2,3-diacylglucosamine pyrophosphatase LpxH